MGTWGSGLFDNDYALDLVIETSRGGTTDPLERVLRAASEEDVSSPAAQEAAAASLIILNAFGKAEDKLPPEAYPWANKHVEILRDGDLARLALAALKRVSLPSSDLSTDWFHEDVRDDYLSRVTTMVRSFEEITAAEYATS